MLFPKEVLGRELATRDLAQWLQKLQKGAEGPQTALEKPIATEELPVEHEELQPKSFLTRIWEKLSASPVAVLRCRKLEWIRYI